MVVVFQGETGGYITYDIVSTISAVSGYIDIADKYRMSHRVYGTISSGQLYISKSGISSLNFGSYIIVPQIIDSDGLKYFLYPVDLYIVEVPPIS